MKASQEAEAVRELQSNAEREREAASELAAAEAKAKRDAATAAAAARKPSAAVVEKTCPKCEITFASFSEKMKHEAKCTKINAEFQFYGNSRISGLWSKGPIHVNFSRCRTVHSESCATCAGWSGRLTLSPHRRHCGNASDQ